MGSIWTRLGSAAFFERVREPRDPVLTSEDVVLNSVGRDLYEKFFLNYTRKQWGLEPSQLKAGVAARIPVRTNTDDRYFTDIFQGMPLRGYTRMFEAMLDHPNIRVELGVDFQDIKGLWACSTCGLHRPDRRLFRLLLWPLAVPLASLSSTST